MGSLPKLMPADPNKLPSPKPFPSQELRKEREAKVEKRRVGRPRTFAGPDDKWMHRRMVTFRLEHIHWHNVRWFARKDRVSKGEYMKRAIMLYNYINFQYPLNKRLLLDLDERLKVFVEWYRQCLCTSAGDPLVGIEAVWEAPYRGKPVTDEEKAIVAAIKLNIERLKHAKLKAASKGEGEVPASRQEEQVSGSIAQSNVGGSAA